MDVDECRRRFAAAGHAYLATVRPDGAPHLVPVVVDLTGEEVTSAVDHKPKRATELQRIRNVRGEPRVSLLVDEWSSDWGRLWWVRADALAQVHDGGPVHDEAVDRLVRRHPQYRAERPSGPVLVATVVRWVGWSAR